ncbi:MAG: tRNA1(Val) (adenine(37)-N6)-methyltransferase [Desulfosarcina sp.]|nr:tRNA1(Val) (adenine(37)-N6)-methyltransferase [Desulfobacterales bacterium]
MDLTADTFFNGRLKVFQGRAGYRFSIDALLLAHQVKPRKGDRRVVDFGTGCGILPLLMAYRHGALDICGVEIQPALAHLARENVQANGLTHRIRVIEADLQTVTPQRLGFSADLIVSNPPYRQAASGRINPHEERALARHEIALTLEGLLRSVRRVLRTGGYFWTIYPSERLPELIRRMQRFHIEPKFMRLIHSRAHSDARLVVMAGVKAAGAGLAVGPPLVIYRDERHYTAEVQAMFNP